MYAPVHLSIEEGSQGGNPLVITGDGLSTEHLAILIGILEGKDLGTLAESIGWEEDHLAAAIQRPPLSQRLGRINQQIGKRILDGDFGVTAILKSEGPKAAKRLIAISKDDRDPRVQFQATKEILVMGGHRPPQEINIKHDIHHILQTMNEDELDHFANSGEWPERLRDQLHAWKPDQETIIQINQGKRSPTAGVSKPRTFEPLEEDEIE